MHSKITTQFNQSHHTKCNYQSLSNTRCSVTTFAILGHQTQDHRTSIIIISEHTFFNVRKTPTLSYCICHLFHIYKTISKNIFHRRAKSIVQLNCLESSLTTMDLRFIASQESPNRPPPPSMKRGPLSCHLRLDKELSMQERVRPSERGQR